MNRDLKTVPLKARRLISLALLTLLAGAGCERVLAPTSDSTPPTLRWELSNVRTGTRQNIAGSGGVDVRVGDRYRVTLFAEDPQGIHAISLGSSTGWGCSNGDLGQNSGPGLGVTDTQTLAPDSQGYVVTLTLMLRTADIGPYTCPGGWSFTGGSVSFLGTGENYFSGTTRAQLVLNVLP